MKFTAQLDKAFACTNAVLKALEKEVVVGTLSTSPTDKENASQNHRIV